MCRQNNRLSRGWPSLLRKGKANVYRKSGIRVCARNLFDVFDVLVRCEQAQHWRRDVFGAVESTLHVGLPGGEASRSYLFR